MLETYPLQINIMLTSAGTALPFLVTFRIPHRFHKWGYFSLALVHPIYFLCTQVKTTLLLGQHELVA